MDIDIKKNLDDVRSRIARACIRAGRSPDSVRLVAAGKGVGPERIKEAINYGVNTIGENRVQEALVKIKEIGLVRSQESLVTSHLSPIFWHMIGRLQRNKIRDVVGRFDLIHSVDSIPLAKEIGKWAAKIGLVQKILIEVNLGGEATKGGIFQDRALDLIKEIALNRNISIKGLMAIPPMGGDPNGSRIFFRILRDLAAIIAKEGIDEVDMEELSMGMSDDFEIAVEEGATLVRIGRAIFGPRGDRDV